MLKAIETKYKGYRFRSRLEARWAVFFEEHGARWEFEQEGFELPLGRYLPDFYLPGRRTFVEVKPGPRPSYAAPRVYMAGRMNDDPRDPGGVLRPFDISVGCEGIESRKSWVACRNIGSQKIHYCGPWEVEGQHCGFHGCMDDGLGTEKEVMLRSLDGIAKADVVLAMLDDRLAFGTLVEIGYAAGLGKKVLLGGDPHKILDNEYQREIEGLQGRGNDLWFAFNVASAHFEGDRRTVLKKFENWLSQSYPWPREQVLAEQLHAASGQTVVVVYGDPVEAFADECANCWQARGNDPYPFFQEWSFQERDEAALKARQARFEFGAAGAPV